jgi:hypothetical protein
VQVLEGVRVAGPGIGGRDVHPDDLEVGDAHTNPARSNSVRRSLV